MLSVTHPAFRDHHREARLLPSLPFFSGNRTKALLKNKTLAPSLVSPPLVKSTVAGSGSTLVSQSRIRLKEMVGLLSRFGIGLEMVRNNAQRGWFSGFDGGSNGVMARGKEQGLASG
ncbi:hypothetical protein V6N12_028897 [Hibiscus sabdariffa]|uniref:Uncharacterized protein n=1 Tax=Hibiscus sabdariffa TaxID=183260 RepID=A0ABR2F748_9ROSI